MASSKVYFRDLKAFVAEQEKQQQQQLQQNIQQSKQLAMLRGLPFYRWDLSEEEHSKLAAELNGYCCFNDAIGRPVKNGVEHPLYDYERDAFDTIFKQDGSIRDKHTLILKATGLGISELALRIVAWLCLKDDVLAGSQICLITGPRIDLSITLVERLKRLFYARNIVTSFESKETVAFLNGVRVEAFPSHHLSSMRGLQNVSMIVADESAFFPANDQAELRDTIERYIGKSSSYIILLSTPNRPGDLMDQIMSEPEESCIYRRLTLPWNVGLNKIFTEQEMQMAKASPSWPREYELKFSGQIGNSFTQQSIDLAVERGKSYDPDYIDSLHFLSRSMGIDVGWGSSAFGIVVTEFVDGIVRVCYAEEFQRPDYPEMLSLVYGLMSKYQIDKVYVDGSAPSFVKSLKLQIGEEADYLEQIARLKSDGIDNWQLNMRIVPVSFGVEHREMLAHVKMILESDGGRIAINPDKFDKLIVALRTATDQDGSLHKEETSYDDLLDGLRLSLKFYSFGQG